MKRGSRQLIVGQFVGQVALLLAIPALTRLLPVAEMGIYQAAFSIATVLQPLATLRRELLIPFSGISDTRRHRMVGLGFAAVLCSIIGVGGAVAAFLGYSNLAATLFSTAVVLLSLALTFVENAYLIRRAAHTRLAWRNLAGGVLCAVLQITIAFVVPSAIAIAAALLVGRGIATASTVVREVAEDEVPGGGERDSQRSISAIVSALAASASSQAMVVVSLGTLGPSASAQIAIGQRVAGTPASLIGQALTQIALGAASPLIRNQRPGLTAQLRGQTLKAAALASIASVGLMIGAPLLAVPVLGPEYQEAGPITAILAIPLGLTLVALPATSLMIPLGRERLLATLQILRLTAIVATIGVTAAISGNLITTSLATATVWSFAYVPLLTASFRATMAHDRRYGDPPVAGSSRVS